MYIKKDESYQFIRFVLTWTILVHHVLTTAKTFDIARPFILNGVFSRISYGFGQMSVAMFFILSGALLWKNHKTIKSINLYYISHISKLLIPIWIASIPLLLLNYLKSPEQVLSAYTGKTLIINFLGLDLYSWILFDKYPFHVCGEWFTSVILTLYLLYPLLRPAFLRNKSRLIASICITIVFLLNLRFKIMTKGDGWYSFTLGIFYFWIGMLFEEYKERITTRYFALGAFFCFIIIALFFNNTIFGSVFIPIVIASICSFIVLYRFAVLIRPVLNKPFFANIIAETCAKSYLIYLCHHFLITLFMPYLMEKDSNTFQFYIFILFIALLSYGYSSLISPATVFLSKQMTKRFNSKKELS